MANESSALISCLTELRINSQSLLTEQRRTNELLTSLLSRVSAAPAPAPAPVEYDDDDDDDEEPEAAPQAPWVGGLMDLFTSGVTGMLAGDGKPTAPKE